MKPSELLPSRLLPQILWRREALFDGHEEFIKDKTILEIAPSHCLFTEKMLDLGAKEIELVEKDPEPVDLARKYFAEDKRIKIRDDDIHFSLPKLVPRFETIVCAGFLYHSPHPLWILEGMANLSPEYILIDTACSHTESASMVPEKANEQGFRQVDGANCGYALRLSPLAYMQIMKNLGYRPVAQLNQKEPVIDPSWDEKQIEILNGWKYTFSYWFQKI
jgi:hypothetical protein